MMAEFSNSDFSQTNVATGHHRVPRISPSTSNPRLLYHDDGDAFDFVPEDTKTNTTTTSIINPNNYSVKLDNNVTTSSSLSSSFSITVWRQQQQQQSGYQYNQDPTSITLIVVLPLLSLCAAYIWCARSSVPGPEHRRGAQIRENARRNREARLRRKVRQEMEPDQRREQMLTHMKIMTIVNKDKMTGILKLGSQRWKDDDDDDVIFDDDDAAVAVVPSSLKEKEEQPSTMMMTAHEHHHQDQDATIKTSRTKDTEESLCYICLDNFDVSDVVMWSPQRSRCCNNNNTSTQRLGCQHVFHYDCLMPWLMEKRENECPICRTPFIIDQPISNKEEEETAVVGRNSSGNNSTNIDPRIDVDFDRRSIQLNMGDGSETTIIETDTTTVDLEALASEKGVISKDDGDDNNMPPSTMDEIPEGYSYFIAKGLIQIVPNNHHQHNNTLALTRISCIDHSHQILPNRGSVNNDT